VGGGNEPTALAALFAAWDVSHVEQRPAEASFPPYGVEAYQHQQYDMAPQYNRDAPPAYGAGFGGPGMPYQPWANGGAPLIY
jgi:hypothetical protein